MKAQIFNFDSDLFQLPTYGGYAAPPPDYGGYVAPPPDYDYPIPSQYQYDDPAPVQQPSNVCRDVYETQCNTTTQVR